MDQSTDFQQLLQQVQQAALHGTPLPTDLHEQVSIADLQALAQHIGAQDIEIPGGAFDDLPRTSIEWANLSTAYRGQFENHVFGLAADKGETGLDFLLDTVLEPIPQGEDPLSWTYAKATAMRWAGTCVANGQNPSSLLDQAVNRMEVRPELVLPQLPEFLRGITFWSGDAPRQTLQRLLNLCQQAQVATQQYVDWDFAQIFRTQAPAMCQAVAQEQLDRLEGQPFPAMQVEQLSFILSMQLFFPEEPLLKQSISQSTALWLTNTHFAEGLYLLLSIWNHPHFAPVLVEMKQHIAILERIAQGEPPETGAADQSVDEIEQLRAHMVLSRLSEDPTPHREFIQQVASEASPEEQAYFQRWLAES